MEFNLNTTLLNLLKKLHLFKNAEYITVRINQNIYETVKRAFVSFLLFGIDFVLFAGAGNFSIFDNFFFADEVFGVLLIVGALITAIYAAFTKIRIVQDALVGFSFFAFFYAIGNQFAQFDTRNFIADWFSLSVDNIFQQYSALFVSATVKIIK